MNSPALAAAIFFPPTARGRPAKTRAPTQTPQLASLKRTPDAYQHSCFRFKIKYANSPTFLVFSTSPTRKRTPKDFSTDTTSEMCVSESHSGTSFALMAGVSTTGSKNTVSKMVCNLAITSAWLISEADVFNFGRHRLERFQPQFEFP